MCFDICTINIRVSNWGSWAASCFRNIWIVTGELLDAFPARDDQNHPVTHVCVCKGMRGLYTILMDRHCFCWRRLDDGSLSVETSPWLLSFIDLIHVESQVMCFPKKTNPILLVVLVLCVSSPSQICCTVYPFSRCVCWWNPYVSWLSPMWVLWVDVRICVGYQRPMFVNGLLNNFLLAFLVDIQFFLLLIHFEIPWHERNISSKAQFWLVKQAIPRVRLHCDVTGMILSKGSCPQMVLNQVMNSCNLSRTR